MTNRTDDNSGILTYLEAEFEAGTSGGASPRFGRKKKAPEVILPSAREVLVELALGRAMSEDAHHKISTGAIRMVVANVPDAGWANPIADALSDITDEPVHTIVRDKVPQTRDLADHRLPEWAHAGEHIVGVAPEADRALPPLLLSIAELHIDVPAPDAEMVAEVIRHCQKGKVPPEVLELQPQVLSFDELCSLIPQGGTAAETVARLKATIERKLDGGGRKRKSLPRLEDAIEYGAARDWALALRDDIADYRRGLIGWEEVDRGAVFYGPPGTGKTLLAQMLGEAVGIPTVISSMAELCANSSGYLDGVIKAMRKVFDEAKAKNPRSSSWTRSTRFRTSTNWMPAGATGGAPSSWTFTPCWTAPCLVAMGSSLSAPQTGSRTFIRLSCGPAAWSAPSSSVRPIRTGSSGSCDIIWVTTWSTKTWAC